ncbi:hypothetical protein OAJ07_01220 [Gemmatimonadales bacterium]|nr:hypothetical protein [Gemmatimonadales bacterium]
MAVGVLLRLLFMAWIPYITDEDASSVLSQFYHDYSDDAGSLDHILRIHSLNPRSMKDHAELYGHLMRGPSPLTRVQREMIGVAVSVENKCFY